jgi:hypothetical protein
MYLQKMPSLLILEKGTEDRERLLLCYYSIPAEHSRIGNKNKERKLVLHLQLQTDESVSD